MSKKYLLLLSIALGLSVIVLFVVKERQKADILPPKPPAVTPPINVPPKPKVYTFDEALDTIVEGEIKTTLYYLASDELEGRMTGKQGQRKAASFIENECKKADLQVMYHKFTSSDIGRRIQGINNGPNNERGDNWCQNIYAWIEGNDPQLKNEIVVIGAHLDHIGYGPSMSRSSRRDIHPGADDNASGSTAVLEVAKAFSLLKNENKRTVVFQWYSAEEMGLLGSRFYCNNPLFPKDSPNIKNHVAMINLDMVGYLGKGYYFTGFYGAESSLDISKIINELNGKHSFARQITSRGSGGSDHASFYNKRVPVAFLHTGSHRYYHTPQDTPDKINYKGVESVSRYCFELAWKICQAEDKPQFNHATFKEMEYKHDHGHPDVPFLHDHDHDHGHNHNN